MSSANSQDNEDDLPELVPIHNHDRKTDKKKFNSGAAVSSVANSQGDSEMNDDSDNEPPGLVPLNAKLPRGLRNYLKEAGIQDDDMSVDTNSFDDEDSEYESYDEDDEDVLDVYDEDDEDDDDDEDDEDDEDDDEDDDSLDSAEPHDLCQCPTCRREREKQHKEQRRMVQEREASERLKQEKFKREMTPKGPGSRTVKFHKTPIRDAQSSMTPDGKVLYRDNYIMSITGMLGYCNKSTEELRYEDYADDDPEIKKVKDFLDSELADRIKESVCRAHMELSEANMRKWMPQAAIAMERYKKGLEIYNNSTAKDKQQTASEFFTLAIEKCATGDHARGCYFLRAKCNMKILPRKAISDLESCLKIDKNNAEALYLLGYLTLTSQNLWEKAESYMEKAYNLDHKLFEENKEWSKNFEVAKKKADLQRKFDAAEVKKTLGNAALSRQSYTEAERLYTAAIDICPDRENSHIYYCNRATARCEIGLRLESDPDTQHAILIEAVIDCESSLNLKEDYVKAHFRHAYCKGIAKFLKLDYGGAQSELEDALKLDPENQTVQQELKKVNASIKTIEAKERVKIAELEIAEREALRAKEKENEKKEMDAKREAQEKARKDKAQKLEEEKKARALAKVDREANKVGLAKQAAEDKLKEKERLKAEKEKEKEKRDKEKVIEREQKKIEKEKEKERLKLEKEAEEIRIAEEAEKQRLRKKQFDEDMDRFSSKATSKATSKDSITTKKKSVSAGVNSLSSIANAISANASTSSIEIEKVKSAAVLTTTKEEVSNTCGSEEMSTFEKAKAPEETETVVAPTKVAPIKKSTGPVLTSVLASIASSVSSSGPRKESAASKLIKEQKLLAAANSAAGKGIGVGGTDRSASASPAPGASVMGTVRSTSDTAPNGTAGTNKAIITAYMDCEASKVGIVIGSKGSIINEIMKRSGCKIIVNLDFPDGQKRKIVMTGTVEQVDAAKPLISAVLALGPNVLTSPDTLSSFLEGEKTTKSPIPDTSLGSDDAFLSSLPTSFDVDSTCMLCNEKFDTKQRLYSFGSCNHKEVCSMCMLKQRAMSYDMNCPVCRVHLDKVVVSKDPKKSFESYNLKGTKLTDIAYHHESGMFFPKDLLNVLSKRYLLYRCKECNMDCKEINRLKDHYQRTHNLRICDLCHVNKKTFPGDIPIYNKVDYARHMKGTGLDPSGAGGHPECIFCQVYFFDKTEFYRHVNQDHFTCQLCTKEGSQYKYFRDDKMLEAHSKQAHFVCDEEECTNKKINNSVFRSLFDLQAHKRSFHSSSGGSGGHELTQAQVIAQAQAQAQANASEGYDQDSDSFALNTHNLAYSNTLSGVSGISGISGLGVGDINNINSINNNKQHQNVVEPDFIQNMLDDHISPSFGSSNHEVGCAPSGLGIGGLLQQSNTPIGGGMGGTDFPLGSMLGGIDNVVPPLDDFQLPLSVNQTGLGGGGGGLAGLLGPSDDPINGNSNYLSMGGINHNASDFFSFPGGLDNNATTSSLLPHSKLGGGVEETAHDINGNINRADSSNFIQSFSNLGSNLGSGNFFSQQDTHNGGLNGGGINGGGLNGGGLPGLSHDTNITNASGSGLLGGNNIFSDLLGGRALTSDALGGLNGGDSHSLLYKTNNNEDGMDSDGYESDILANAKEGDLRVPVHDLPHDQFHELDEVSSSNAAIIRATFAPEFIDRLISVLKSHPEGILGSAFPEAYRKIYSQRLILETKRGKKIKLLSVLEGHSNFYKSGVRIGGLKFHYKGSHEPVPTDVGDYDYDMNEMNNSPPFNIIDNHTNNGLGGWGSGIDIDNSPPPGLMMQGDHNEEKFDNTGMDEELDQEQDQLDQFGDCLNSLSSEEAYTGPEGLEVDLLGDEAFPSMAWLAQHRMHMYRWAGNETEWTEYALRLRPDVLAHFRANRPGASVSVLEQIKAGSGCDVSLQAEKLKGKEETFLILVRGDTGLASNTAFIIALELANKVIREYLESDLSGKRISSNSSLSDLSSGNDHENGVGSVGGIGLGVSSSSMKDAFEDNGTSKIGEDGRVHRVLDIPQSAVNIIKGNAGKKLYLIRKKSGAFVNPLTKFKGKGPAKLNISGTPAAVKTAIRLVKECLSSEG